MLLYKSSSHNLIYIPLPQFKNREDLNCDCNDLFPLWENVCFYFIWEPYFEFYRPQAKWFPLITIDFTMCMFKDWTNFQSVKQLNNYPVCILFNLSLKMHYHFFTIPWYIWDRENLMRSGIIHLQSKQLVEYTTF